MVRLSHLYAPTFCNKILKEISHVFDVDIAQTDAILIDYAALPTSTVTEIKTQAPPLVTNIMLANQWCRTSLEMDNGLQKCKEDA